MRGTLDELRARLGLDHDKVQMVGGGGHEHGEQGGGWEGCISLGNNNSDNNKSS